MERVHKCNKEREIGVMMTEIKIIKEDLKEVKTDLKAFISTADEKYATKKELEAVKTENSKQEKEIKSIWQTIGKMAKEWGTMIGMFAVLTKQFNLW